jgi:sugar-specific transcriptional regulator TrmB
MVGLKASSEELKEITGILGLDDDEQGIVYLNLLSLGMATLGQLSLISGLDFIQTQETLNVLVGSNLVKRIPGKIGRYIALQPFLKAFLLSYDPITLFNVRKDSKSTLLSITESIQEKLTKTSEKFQTHTASLETDFSESLKPIADSSASLSYKQQESLRLTKEDLQNNYQMIKEQIQNVIQNATSLYHLINEKNVEKIDQIPAEFMKRAPELKERLLQIHSQISKKIDNIAKTKDQNLGEIDEKFDEELQIHGTQIKEILSDFKSEINDNREKNEEIFFETKSKLEKIKNDADKSHPRFNEVKSGFLEVQSSIDGTADELSQRVAHMEELLKAAVNDIDNRKMFRGKDEFLGILKSIEKENYQISNLLQPTQDSLSKVKVLNSHMNEIESKLVQATDLGLELTNNVFEDRRRIIKDQLNSIEKQIDQNLSAFVNETLLTTNNKVTESLNRLRSGTAQILREMNQDLELSLTKSLEYLLTQIEESVGSLTNEISKLFQVKKSEDIDKSELYQMLTRVDEVSSKVNIELNNTMKMVSGVDSTLESYFLGLSSFTKNYAEAQLETYSTNLNETRELIGMYLEKTETQLEHEISALIYSIKQMKQKLSKVITAMNSVDITDIDPSLLDSDLIIGEPVIIMLLRDLTMRTKSSLTILMPRPELQTLRVASKLPFKARVTIIGDFRKVPKATLKKVTASSNLRLKQLDGIEFWGCIRDAEELLICPEPKNLETEDLVGVITTNVSLVGLFTQEIITYTTRSRELLPSDLE